MTHFLSRAATAAALSLLLAGSAFAQTPATTPADKSAPVAKSAPSEAKTEKPRTAASLDCSKQADAKGLHGKERKTFRSECKKTSKVN